MSHTSLSSALAGSRIPGLDFLRALAVLFVLIDHTEYKFGGPLGMLNGGTGVEIFFVLSGFLITSMLLKEVDRFGSISFRDFFQRRAARLLPVFYVYVVVGVIYLTIRHKPIPWDAVVSSAFYVINYHQAFNGAPAHFLSHCWSLAVEEQFYFVWPILFVFVLGVRWRVDLLLLGLILTVWIYRAVSYLTGWHSDEYIYRALDTRADHLLVGCLLAVLIRRPVWITWFERLWRMPMLMIALAVALLVSGTWHGDLTYKYVFAYAIEPLIIAVLIPMVVLSASKESGWLSRGLNAGWVVSIGQASYGIYLFHQLLMHPVRTFVENKSGSYHLAIAASFAVVIVVAHQSFVRFEAPIRQRLLPKPRVA